MFESMAVNGGIILCSVGTDIRAELYSMIECVYSFVLVIKYWIESRYEKVKQAKHKT